MSAVGVPEERSGVVATAARAAAVAAAAALSLLVAWSRAKEPLAMVMHDGFKVSEGEGGLGEGRVGGRGSLPLSARPSPLPPRPRPRPLHSKRAAAGKTTRDTLPHAAAAATPATRAVEGCEPPPAKVCRGGDGGPERRGRLLLPSLDARGISWPVGLGRTDGRRRGCPAALVLLKSPRRHEGAGGGGGGEERAARDPLAGGGERWRRRRSAAHPGRRRGGELGRPRDSLFI